MIVHNPRPLTMTIPERAAVVAKRMEDLAAAIRAGDVPGIYGALVVFAVPSPVADQTADLLVHAPGLDDSQAQGVVKALAEAIAEGGTLLNRPDKGAQH